MRIPVRLNNQSNQPRTVALVVDLPAGSQWLGSTGGLIVLQNGTPISANASPAASQKVITVTIPAQGQSQVLLSLRLPVTAGTAVVRTTVRQDSSAGAVVTSQENRYVVRSIADRLALLQQATQNWSIIGKDGFGVTNLKVQLKLIETHLRTGHTELAVYEAARMGTSFSEMTSTPDRDLRKLRLEGDELLKALEIKWYLERNGRVPLP